MQKEYAAHDSAQTCKRARHSHPCMCTAFQSLAPRLNPTALTASPRVGACKGLCSPNSTNNVTNCLCVAFALLSAYLCRHYQPWWLQPPMIIATGVAFVLASLWLDNEELSKTALLAAGPVALYWGIFLFVLPRRFKSFAVEYIEAHPEAEEAAREQQQQQVEELMQQHHEQQQQEQSQSN